jgi:hypothetical protein
VYVLCSNVQGVPQAWFGGYVQALAIYNTTLNAAQVLAISSAMASL